jgi:hypothetical protein
MIEYKEHVLPEIHPVPPVSRAVLLHVPESSHNSAPGIVLGQCVETQHDHLRELLDVEGAWEVLGGKRERYENGRWESHNNALAREIPEECSLVPKRLLPTNRDLILRPPLVEGHNVREVRFSLMLGMGRLAIPEGHSEHTALVLAHSVDEALEVYQPMRPDSADAINHYRDEITKFILLNS